MPSSSLDNFFLGSREVSTLLGTDPTPLGHIPHNPDLTRSVTRACVVILCSHFERYLRSVNEEAILLINKVMISHTSVPLTFRLRHASITIDDIAKTSWEHRQEKLEEYTRTDAWLWGTAIKGTLNHERILQWMKSPTPRSIIRFYKLWDFEDIFGTITRNRHTYQHFFLIIDELVGKRNNIAHGDFTTEATASQIVEYQTIIEIFCRRTDKQLSRKLHTLFRFTTNWY